MFGFSWSLIVFLLGLGIFFNGFFLSRKELGILSDSSLSLPIDTEKRVFLFIIDALRFDFVAPVSSKTCTGNSPYNCFSTIHRLLSEQPENSAIFRFIADPPTVTAQRLKGLTVGCLPTFIDVSSNINSAAVTDDNILAQLRSKLNKTKHSTSTNVIDQIITLGDDTWQSLFPRNVFDKLIMFDSFNTWDLDTVDNGILSHLWNYLPKEMDKQKAVSSNWKLLIAHFLGVDHVGHSFHAEHPLMSQRLKLMDEILNDVIDRLPEDAVLFVFGDHGMTIEGEHGGASPDETDSALFVYSKQPFRNITSPEQSASRYRQWSELSGEFEYMIFNNAVNPRSISQMDLVPTLAYLLNLPIPFSSLGKFIPEIMVSSKDKVDYIQLLDILRRNTLQIVSYFLQYRSIETEPPLKNNEVLSNLEAAASLVNKNHIFSVAVENLLLTAVSLDKELLTDLDKFLTDNDNGRYHERLAQLLQYYYHFLNDVQLMARQEWTEFKNIPIMIGLLFMTGSIVSLLVWNFCVEFALLPMGRLQIKQVPISTSMYYFSTVMVLFGGIFQLLFGFSNSFVVEEKQICFVLLQSWIALVNILYLLELDECIVSGGSRIIGTAASLIAYRIIWGLSQNAEENVIMFIAKYACACWFIFLTSLSKRHKYLIKYSNNFMESPPHKLFRSNLGFLLQFCIFAFHWMSSNYVDSQSDCLICLPQIILIGCISIIILTALTSQLSVSVLYDVLLALYTLYMLTWRQQLLVLAVADGIKFEITNFFYYISNRKKRSLQKIKGQNFGIILACVITIFLLFSFSRFLFFLTGHACQFDRLQLQVAFIGQEQFSAVYGGFALGINTLGQEVLPLLLWKKIINEQKIERKLSDNICRGYALLRMGIMLSTCIASFHLRRHLMLWAVFAPKLVFEIALATTGLIISWLSCSC